jgi:hypothetical protein
MKLKRILAIPFAVAADLATLGNMGGRGFTEQLFDAERREQRELETLRALKAITDLARASK